ncbi:hypothetical protein [Spirosoma endophyticum]|uniref:Uncharacterized protein n=1 Tax=Spirosoma endophyticum TaxID=662367 RepID=A0A1I1HW37_9BACT|nr:hypothetical protein [Spirosoma endophyticum]SFC26178.1 hypothetical protein SAMN05216167_101759 [Spirosoma endophyticum]
MEHNKLKFSNLLEQYVYGITSIYIAHVDSEAQSKLIKLFNSINKELPLRAKQSKGEVSAIKQLIAAHQIKINLTLSYILRVDTLVVKAEKISPNSVKTVRLISRYLSLKNKYSDALVKIRVLQKKDIDSIKR